MGSDRPGRRLLAGVAPDPRARERPAHWGSPWLPRWKSTASPGQPPSHSRSQHLLPGWPCEQTIIKWTWGLLRLQGNSDLSLRQLEAKLLPKWLQSSSAHSRLRPGLEQTHPSWLVLGSCTHTFSHILCPGACRDIPPRSSESCRSSCTWEACIPQSLKCWQLKAPSWDPCGNGLQPRRVGSHLPTAIPLLWAQLSSNDSSKGSKVLNWGCLWRATSAPLAAMGPIEPFVGTTGLMWWQNICILDDVATQNVCQLSPLCGKGSVFPHAGKWYSKKEEDTQNGRNSPGLRWNEILLWPLYNRPQP